MRCLVLTLVACGSPGSPKPAAPKPAVPVAACASPEHRQLDFWIGDWDVAIRARASLESEEWGEAKGRQRIESVLGGCAISESFSGEGPKQPWAGRSYSSWQAPLGKWRQTWVDDSGGYIALSGGVEDGEMRLYGEPRTVNGESFQMRMVFQKVTADSLHWEWQRSADEWVTSKAMMTIDYSRRR